MGEKRKLPQKDRKLILVKTSGPSPSGHGAAILVDPTTGVFVVTSRSPNDGQGFVGAWALCPIEYEGTSFEEAEAKVRVVLCRP